MHFPVTPEAAKAYQDILLQEAQGSQLAGTIKVARPGLWDRLLVGTGDWLIARGQGLRQRAGPPARALPDPRVSANGKVGA